jgi:hypothetical protein
MPHIPRHCPCQRRCTVDPQDSGIAPLSSLHRSGVAPLPPALYQNPLPFSAPLQIQSQQSDYANGDTACQGFLWIFGQIRQYET